MKSCHETGSYDMLNVYKDERTRLLNEKGESWKRLKEAENKLKIKKA